ncbi:MAG: bifunctional folylpolyglutamate synthase/dihydrofolate synthase [bacterium]|nr:bifunctional folylpolyglutamate synthase/dihydrofolate synthase [bacterium]
MRRHNYVSAEKYILSREFFGMKLGLDNISEFLSDIGTPQDKFPTIHISGTNGKGSTAAMLDSILRAAGYKCGLFTSPHLVSLRERVRVNGQPIPKRSVTAFIDRHRHALSRRKLSFFELITAMAFEHFNRSKVDVAVIETGLGGRLDASNVLHPELTITTEVSRDHIEILGDSVEKIAFEKAGIVKTEVPHLIGIMPKTVERIFRERCRQMGAPLVRLRRNEYQADPTRMLLSLSANGLSVARQEVGLYGVHQIRNAALAVKAAMLLKERGWKINRASVSLGLKSVSWPGRFQISRTEMGQTLVLDVGHNSSGVKSLVDSFEKRFPGRKATVITGLVKRKEHQEIFDHLSRIAGEYHLVPLNSRRSVDIAELSASIDFGPVGMVSHRSLMTGYKKVLKSSGIDDIILVVGSHYLVGEFIEKFQLK